jgi:hypothetical protein
MQKSKAMSISVAIVFMLLGLSHLIHFLSPALNYTDLTTGSSVIPDDSTEIDTPEEFMIMALYLEEYDWDNYNDEDFPEWMYMPTAESVENNETELIPFGAYNWSEYDKNDFPSFLDMPDNASEIDTTSSDWVLEYVDAELKAELLEYAATYENAESETEMILPLIDFYEMVYALIFFIVGAIFYMISRIAGGKQS